MSKININKLPKSEVEIEGEIEADVFEAYFTKALKKIGENVEKARLIAQKEYIDNRLKELEK